MLTLEFDSDGHGQARGTGRTARDARRNPPTALSRGTIVLELLLALGLVLPRWTWRPLLIGGIMPDASIPFALVLNDERMREPTTRLRLVDDDMLEALLAVAVAEADPIEAMPPVDGPPGWTAARREAFRAFHRARRDGLAGPLQEATFAIVADGKVVGSARLQRKEGPATLEAGLWLARSARGRGIGTAALRALLDEAAAAGAHTLIAETTESNAAALGALRGIGARLTVDDASGHVHAHLPVARRACRQ